MKKNKPVIKCPNSKNTICDWIISSFPENYQEMIYLEPFCGDMSVLLNKENSQVEIVNDIDINIIQIYRALRDEPKELIRRLNLCKYCEDTFLKASKKKEFEDYLEHAVNELILRRMSKGELKEKFALSNRLKDGQPTEIASWISGLKELNDISERIKEIYMFNKPAIDIVKAFNFSNTLIYCDPPYLHETKVTKTVYSSEMDTDSHIELSHILNNFNGKVVVSGLLSPLYNRLYKGWNIEKKKNKDKDKKMEILWKNF